MGEQSTNKWKEALSNLWFVKLWVWLVGKVKG